MGRILTEGGDTTLTPEEREYVGELERLARSFMALGFSAKPSLQLAVNDVSPSAARELLRKGCSLETALRILL